ncbi:MAG TPA: NADH-quinone oxidoreductase subunit K [Holophaga sp.]|nr:NADH-quinone oxidoreductase subunit K [Holophaga sp.]HPS67136.1 NADH-quinone oxidoreductase subunit K [Holophaga sp.]
MSSEVYGLFFFGLLTVMVGVYLLLGYRNLIRIMLGVEVISKGTTMILLGAGLYQGRPDFIQVLIVTFIIVEAILAAVMLGIVIISHKIHVTLDIRRQSKLKG